jgi:hypothetical protein
MIPIIEQARRHGEVPRIKYSDSGNVLLRGITQQSGLETLPLSPQCRFRYDSLRSAQAQNPAATDHDLPVP